MDRRSLIKQAGIAGVGRCVARQYMPGRHPLAHRVDFRSRWYLFGVCDVSPRRSASCRWQIRHQTHAPAN